MFDPANIKAEELANLLNCQISTSWNFYDLSSLKLTGGDWSTTNNGNTLNLNFCQNLVGSYSSRKVMATATIGGITHSLSRSFDSSNTMYANQRDFLYNGESNKGGLRLQYYSDEQCSSGNNFMMTLDMVCIDGGSD